MDSRVWVYFSKTGTGYECKGSDIISAFDAFLFKDGTYLVVIGGISLGTFDEQTAIKRRDDYRKSNGMPEAEY